MEAVMERECSALGGLFQTVIGDMKYSAKKKAVHTLMNFLSGSAKLAIWLSRKNQDKDSGCVDPVMVLKGLVKARLRVEFSYYNMMTDVQNFTCVTMDSVVDRSVDRLDAAGFLQTWQQFDLKDDGFIEGKQLDAFFQSIQAKSGLKMEDRIHQLRESLPSSPDDSENRRLHMHKVAAVILPEEENFLLLFRRETPLDNSVEFMRIWRNYDTDSSGFISVNELKGFLQDLFLEHRRSITPDKLEEYTVTMMMMFDKDKDGRLELTDLARILSLKENFLLKFKMDACSQEDRRRDFEKIFAHYDVSHTGALEGPEVDGFVKDMMELVKPSISGTDLDQFRKALMHHCDINRDGKIQKNELALCLGLKHT